MAEKAPKRKAKPKPAQAGVLGTLPASRPERIGAPRGRAKKPAARRTSNGASGQPKVTAAKPVAARVRNGAAAKSAATPRNGAAAHHGPQAVRPGASALHPHRATDAPPPKPLGAPRGTELVTTSIRAAGELAQIGFTLTGHALKRAVDRIPRP